MDFKVTGTPTSTKTDKKKKTTSAGPAGAAAFSSLLDQASATSEVAEATPVAPVAQTHGILVDDSAPQFVPTDPEERGAYMLEALEELEQDILSGSPTSAINKLKQALETQSEGYDNLSQAQRDIADEIDLRASIEIAKTGH